MVDQIRLTDAGSLQLRRLPLPRSRLIHIRAALSAPEAETSLRPLVVADLLRRLVEWHGAQAVVTAPFAPPDLLRFNVHPPDVVLAPAPVDVLVGAVTSNALSLPVAPIIGIMPAREELALRLHLLNTPYTSPVVLDAASLTVADRRLARWRSWVASDAAAPSAAVPNGYAARLLDRAADDLDTRGILVLLDEIGSDGAVEPGGRFEFLVSADRLLGLDLAAGLWS